MISIPSKYIYDDFDLIGILSILHSNKEVSPNSLSDVFWKLFHGLNTDIESGLRILQTVSSSLNKKIDKEKVCLRSGFWVVGISANSLKVILDSNDDYFYTFLSCIENLRPENIKRKDFSLYYQISHLTDRKDYIAKYIGCKVEDYARESSYFRLHIRENIGKCNMIYYRMRLSFKHLKDISENVM